jgi:serine/threonine protein kinase
MFLGQGSYGEVQERDGVAVKRFPKLSYLIQEYMALRYLQSCEYVVHTCGVDFSRLELMMDLYDCSLRKWIDDNIDSETYRTDMLIIMRDVLLGLTELHDRGLVHGDLKPGNILIRKEPLGAVLGDCGFVSVAKYAKVNLTAPTYRDPVLSRDTGHDIYSFGICFLEMYADIKINRQATYDELKKEIKPRIEDRDVQKILYNILHEDRDRRPSARYLLYRMYGLAPDVWSAPKLEVGNIYDSTGKLRINIEEDIIMTLRKFMKTLCHTYNIKRDKKGYGIVILYLDIHKISPSEYTLHCAVMAMILSSVFGGTRFTEEDILNLFPTLDESDIYSVLTEMLADDVLVSLTLSE